MNHHFMNKQVSRARSVVGGTQVHSLHHICSWRPLWLINCAYRKKCSSRPSIAESGMKIIYSESQTPR